MVEATTNRSLKAQLRQANSLGVSHAVIVGEEEIKTGTAVLRDMTSSRQENVSLDKLPELLRQLLQTKE